MNRMHRLALRLAIAGALAALAACHGGASGPGSPPFTVEKDQIRLDPSGQQPVRFATTAAEEGAPLPLPPVAARVTTVDALTAPSFAPLEGRVVDVRVRLGDHVKQGDKLVQVRAAELASLQHAVGAARLSIRTKQAIALRTRQLVEARAASQNDLLVAESELAEARLAADEAAAKLRSLSVQQAGDTTFWVLATRSGTVVQLDAAPGKQVGPDKDKPVATVADLDEVLVVGDVAQRHAASLSPGMPVKVSFPGSAAPVIEGTVESVSELVDPERQTVPIRVRLPNARRALRPNAYVDLAFAPGGDARVVQVPAEAIVSDGAASVVFVETEDRVFRRRPVQLGRQTRERAEVASGLRAGERVVTTGALLLLNAIDTES